MKINVQSCKYINVSDLRSISADASEAIEALFNSDFNNVSFGDANHTLIDVDLFLSLLEDGMDQQGIFYKEDDTVNAGYLEIKDLLNKYKDDPVYLDLEN